MTSKRKYRILVHIGQLNEVLYEYYVFLNCGKYSKTQIKEAEPLFEQKLGELKEDESAVIAFDIGFTFMKIMNFLFFQQHIFVSHLSLYYCQLHIFLTLLHHKKLMKTILEELQRIMSLMIRINTFMD